MKKTIISLLFPVAILLISFFFFAIFLTSSSIPYSGDFTGSDLTELNLPFRHLAAESFKQGEVPLWTNLLSAGFPLLAEGQAGVFYPFNIALFTLLPFALAVTLSFVINFFLGGFFTYLFSRSLKISQFGSLFSAIAFSFGGFFIFRIKHLNLINAAIWLPLQLYLIEKYFLSRKKSLIILFLGLVFAIQFFAGHVQISYISIVSTILYFCFRLFSTTSGRLNKKIITTLLFWATVGAIAFGISAVQFFPSLEFFESTQRHNWINYETATFFSYHPANILSLIYPYVFGNPATASYLMNSASFGVFWESSIYIGLLSFILSLIAIFFLFSKNKIVRVLTILLAISFLFNLGASNPTFFLFWELIPGFKIFRFPQRFLLLSSLCLAILAGVGFDFVWNNLRQLQTKYSRMVKNKFLITILLPIFVITTLILDLYLVSVNYIGILNQEKYFSPPPSVDFLRQDQDYSRIMSVNWPTSWGETYRLNGGWINNLQLLTDYRNLIPPNLNVFWDIPVIDDRSLFEGGLGGVERFSEIQGHLLGSLTLDEQTSTINFPTSTINILGSQSVKYLMSFFNLNDSFGLTLVNDIKIDFLPSIKTYENKYFLPIIRPYFKINKIVDKADILSELTSSEFDHAQTLIIEEDINLENLLAEPELKEVLLLEMGETKVSASTNFSSDGLLYFGSVYYPGWQVKIDGQSADIIRANYTFMAVVVPEGQHEVEFYYQPNSFMIGKWISLISLLLLFGYFLIYGLKFIIVKNKTTN